MALEIQTIKKTLIHHSWPLVKIRKESDYSLGISSLNKANGIAVRVINIKLSRSPRLIDWLLMNK